jgi:hypothetical protein
MLPDSIKSSVIAKKKHFDYNVVGFLLKRIFPFIAVTPCNRDIILVINGLSSVGTQANFVKVRIYIQGFQGLFS